MSAESSDTTPDHLASHVVAKGSNAGEEQQHHIRRSSSAGSHGAAPQKSGKLVVEWYLSLFDALSTMGTLGAGFTLSVVVLSPPATDKIQFMRFTPSTVNLFGAVSSILFVLTVLVSQGCAQLFRFEQKSIADGLDDEEPLVVWSLASLSLLLQVQVLGAFVMLEVVLAAYQPVVGWVGVALTGALGVVALGLWLLQATGRRPVARLVLWFHRSHRYDRDTLEDGSLPGTDGR